MRVKLWLGSVKGRYGWADKIKVDLQRGNGISWATKWTDGRFLRSRK